MGIEDREKPPWAIRIFAPPMFILTSLGAFSWFFWKFSALVTGITAEVVLIDKGAFYMLGAGVTMLVLSFVMVREILLGKILTDKAASLLSKIGIAGVVIMFSLPHVIHYVSSSYLESNGYTVCEEASHQWLFNKKTVYIQESVECRESLRKEL